METVKIYNENLIEKCESCNWCPFETILTMEQRDRKVLNKSLNRIHPHREIIEQVCGEKYDDICEMKYAIMRTSLSDFDLAQFAVVVKNLCWDYGKKVNRSVSGHEGFNIWTKEHNFGREFDESYASRFREIWDLGLRNFNRKKEPYQTLGRLFIYEVVISDDKKTYNSTIELLKQLNTESNNRDN